MWVLRNEWPDMSPQISVLRYQSSDISPQISVLRHESSDMSAMSSDWPDMSRYVWVPRYEFPHMSPQISVLRYESSDMSFQICKSPQIWVLTPQISVIRYPPPTHVRGKSMSCNSATQVHIRLREWGWKPSMSTQSYARMRNASREDAVTSPQVTGCWTCLYMSLYST